MPSKRSEEHREAAVASRRMTLSQIVERLLERGGSQHSAVDLGLTAGGKVTIGVQVRTSPDGEATTVAEARALAEAMFDELRLKYDQAGADETRAGEAERTARAAAAIARAKSRAAGAGGAS